MQKPKKVENKVREYTKKIDEDLVIEGKQETVIRKKITFKIDDDTTYTERDIDRTIAKHRARALDENELNFMEAVVSNGVLNPN